MANNIVGKASIRINATIQDVWDALTRPELIKQYFFGTDTITDWRVGHPIVFEGEWQGKTYRDKGTVLDFRERELVKYSYWSSMSGLEDKPENYGVVTYTLSGIDNDVLLSVTQENIRDEQTKEHSEQNWKHVLEALKNQVEGA